MLICPQCQFENPDANKFCQSCGISLTYKVCEKCTTNVALNEERCHNCGAEMGTVWWAIISTPLPGTSVKEETPLGAYLDQHQRYQLLEPLPPRQETASMAEMEVRVLDCQPFQLSLLEADAESVTELPAIAATYLALSQSHQKLPAIHDAWQQEDIQVVLIADRSNWSTIIDLLHSDKVTQLQILQWLHDMVQLWAVLEPWKCRQSLLELANLRIDQDGILGLQRLYLEPAEQPLTLQDLGQVWQRLFQEFQKTQFGAVAQMLVDLQAGNIQTINDLRSRLEAISNELQVNITSTLVPPPATTTVAIAPTTTEPSTVQLDQPQANLMNSDDTPTLVLLPQLVSLEDAGRTDVGRQRHHNEDFFGIETAINKLKFPNHLTIQARGLYILCDGMGGHAGGEVASTLAVKTLQEYFQTHWHSKQLPTEETICEAVLLANKAIYDLNQQDARSGTGRMGTTLVMVLLQDTKIAVAHVGDSRLYKFTLLRGLEQVTLDHEVGQKEILRGVEPEVAYTRPDAYQLTQALGPRDENFVAPSVQFIQLHDQNTLLILASDGLSDHDLLEHHWQTHLEPLLNLETDLERGVSNLIDLANQYNGHDNITAVVIRARVQSHEAGPLPL